MATATYTFSTGVPSITPAVYAAGTTTPNLNTTPTATNSAGVLSLTLDIGDYYAQWVWEGDTHQTSGEVASPNTLGEVAAGSGGSIPLEFGSFGGSITFAEIIDLLEVPLATTQYRSAGLSLVDGNIVPTQSGLYRIDVGFASSYNNDARVDIQVYGKYLGQVFPTSVQIPAFSGDVTPVEVWAGTVVPIDLEAHADDRFVLRAHFPDTEPTTGTGSVAAIVTRLGDLPTFV